MAIIDKAGACVALAGVLPLSDSATAGVQVATITESHIPSRKRALRYAGLGLALLLPCLTLPARALACINGSGFNVTLNASNQTSCDTSSSSNNTFTVNGTGETLNLAGTNDTVRDNTHSNTITATGGGDTINAGTADIITLSGSNTLTGAAGANLTTDVLTFDGQSITGNVDQGATSCAGLAYSLSGTTLTITDGGDTLTINNFANGDFGLNVSSNVNTPPSCTPTDTATPPPTDTPTPADTPTPTDTLTPVPSETATTTATATATPVDTATITATGTTTSTPTESPANSATTTPTLTPTPTLAAGCPQMPSNTCFSAGKSNLKLKDNADAAKRQFAWKWNKGALALAQADFGDPVNGSTSYRLCVYDQTSGSPVFKMGATVAPGALWTALGSSGWGYKNKPGNADGITKLSLKGGAAGKPKVQVKGAGASLPLPTPISGTAFFAQDPAVIVQLYTSSSANCWSSTFDASSTKANSGTQFKAVTP